MERFLFNSSYLYKRNIGNTQIVPILLSLLVFDVELDISVKLSVMWSLLFASLREQYFHVRQLYMFYVFLKTEKFIS